MNIRSFHNADLPALVEIWNEHWSSIGLLTNVTTAMLEQAILSRRIFDADRLLIAESFDASETKTVGWCQYIIPSDPVDKLGGATSDARHPGETAIICSLCVRPSNQGVIDDLLQAAETKISQQSATRIDVGLVRDGKLGYAGLAPLGHGIGISSADVAVTTMLTQRGYQSLGPTLRMQTSVTGFRPPVSRKAMQLRRSARVCTEPFSHGDARQAASMSHLDVETHRLLDPAGSELAKISLWLSDAEAEVMDPGMVILELDRAHQLDQLSSTESYLIGTVIQSLAARRIGRVETAVDQGKSNLIDELVKLSFQTSDEGMAWSKKLG